MAQEVMQGLYSFGKLHSGKGSRPGSSLRVRESREDDEVLDSLVGYKLSFK